MHTIAIITLYFLLGFALGRFGDRYGGHLDVLHHWIYGLLMMLLSINLPGPWLALAGWSCGFGVFISDLNDFLHLRIGGADVPHAWRFWSIL